MAVVVLVVGVVSLLCLFVVVVCGWLWVVFGAVIGGLEMTVRLRGTDILCPRNDMLENEIYVDVRVRMTLSCTIATFSCFVLPAMPRTSPMFLSIASNWRGGRNTV